jgi:Domain of unknown function (DUF5069)/Cupin domain
MTVAGAKDLSSVEPHPLDAELDGYAWIPRMLDKARATLAGTNGSYMFGCPVDHTCMARLGVSPALVLELAGRHAEDRDVLEALQRHGIPSAQEEALVAVRGEAIVFLGGHQARIVRAGELARVPAGAEHRIENQGAAPFECVLAYGSATTTLDAASLGDGSAHMS